MSEWDYFAEDPEDIVIAQAHGMLPDDDWTDPAVRCRNGCGWPYAEIVGAKMRTCSAAMVVIKALDYSDHPCECGTRWTCMANVHKYGTPH